METEMEMATLEDLLAEDGFKRGRNRLKSGQIGGASASTPASSRGSRIGSSSSRFFPVRTISDLNPRRAISVMPGKGGSTEPRRSITAGRAVGSMDLYEEVSSDVQKFRSTTFCSSKESSDSIGVFGRSQGHRFSFEEPEASVFKQKTFQEEEESDVSSEAGVDAGSRDGSSVQGNLGYDRFYKNDIYEGVKQNGKKTQNPSFDARDVVRVPALDEAALKAVTSEINNCVNELLKDENLRSSIHQRCLSFLNSSTGKDSRVKNDGALSTLEEAVGAIEKLLTEGPNQLELKKASLKLSVITGVKSMESDDGSNSAIPYLCLAACAHLYLSIICKIQKKDKVSAKHILQIFLDCPCKARTVMLPGLWVRLFLPHLSHLKAWRDKEAESIRGTSDDVSKLEFLEKIYNDILDMGTSQFAAYYRGWLIEGNKAPTLPSILIPSVTFPETAGDINDVGSDDSCDPRNSVPFQNMISKRLYESVSNQAKRIETTTWLKGADEEDKAEEGYLNTWRRYDECLQNDDGYESRSFNSGTNSTDDILEYYSVGSRDWGASSEIMQENGPVDKRSCDSGSSRILEVGEIKVRSTVQAWHESKGYIHLHSSNQDEIENDLRLEKLAQAAFPLQAHIAEVAHRQFFMDVVDTTFTLPGLCSLPLEKNSCAEISGDHENIDNGSLVTGVLKDFICPLTGLLLKDPVTLETGYTFELVAIKERFKQGNKTCPVTGQLLNCTTIPDINIVLKHMINEWMSQCFRMSISVAAYTAHGTPEQACNSKLAFFIIEQLLSSSRPGEKENINHLISIGGADYLVRMLELGSVEDKSRAAGLLKQCIRTDGSCRTYLTMSIRKHSLLELINSKHVHAKSSAVSLLVELICLNRRMDIISFLSGWKKELSKTKDELLECLETSPPEERVLVAVLLLHLDLMEEYKACSAYIEEAVKCIIVNLGRCLSNKEFIANCQKALLMLGGHFSSSGEILTETWLLKQAGYGDNSSSSNDVDDQALPEEEARKREELLKNMAFALLGYGKKPFLETFSLCWKSGVPVLVRLCLVTTAWLSHALVFLPVPALQFSTFLALMPRLKECLNDSLDIKERVLASLCLLNFSRITECRFTIITQADEIQEPLKSLAEVTWTAKQLYEDLFDEEAS